jgi:hypothetical protein
MGLEDIMLNEISQAQKKVHIFSLLCGNEKHCCYRSRVELPEAGKGTDREGEEEVQTKRNG